MLGIEPLELHFTAELHKKISHPVQLINDTDDYVAIGISLGEKNIAFGVPRTTSRLPLRMLPSKDIIPPRSSSSVTITLEALKKPLQEEQCITELCLQSARVEKGLTAKDITSDMFMEEQDKVVAVVNLTVSVRAPKHVLIVKPLELCYWPIEPKKLLPCSVQLTNKTDDFVAFMFTYCPKASMDWFNEQMGVHVVVLDIMFAEPSQHPQAPSSVHHPIYDDVEQDSEDGELELTGDWAALRLEETHIAAHHCSLLVSTPAAQTTSKADKKKIIKISDEKRIKTTGVKLRQGMGWKLDQLLQLTGFAVHLRSCLQIGAEEIDSRKLDLPHEQEEQTTRGWMDPRFQQSTRGNWERSTAASRQEKKLRWCAEARKEAPVQSGGTRAGGVRRRETLTALPPLTALLCLLAEPTGESSQHGRVKATDEAIGKLPARIQAMDAAELQRLKAKTSPLSIETELLHIYPAELRFTSKEVAEYISLINKTDNDVIYVIAGECGIVNGGYKGVVPPQCTSAVLVFSEANPSGVMGGMIRIMTISESHCHCDTDLDNYFNYYYKHEELMNKVRAEGGKAHEALLECVLHAPRLESVATNQHEVA
ncbi:uncharacterized protein C2845_PM03G18630 [Panicum miliaceum]|uniref:MSP domain-containing protein n=1 Tax=Panicum miliaceum TaxID=4540 RepID=A0A3L6TD88_PANMI|nr:uncharacterized protein C2845_PM03G18630 [Panicum miliaceum]